MTAREFCYWLQGYFEISDDDKTTVLGTAQVRAIRRHLEMVFAHDIDPKAGDAAEQAKLNNLHGNDGKSGNTPRC
jgi:hypothetical protein